MRPPPERQADTGTADGEPCPPYRPILVHHRPAVPEAAVLLLHGGRADGLTPPPPVNLPAWRMLPIAWAIRRRLGGGGKVLVASVRYRHRGWNDPHAHAVQDARRALTELAGCAASIPIVLVGHSMGGRAALRAAGAPGVRGVVALAPWCPPGEPVAHLHGRTVFVLHDPADRITEAAGSWAFAERAQQAGAHVHPVAMPLGGHTMLRGARNWHRLTAQAVATILAAAPPSGPRATGDSA